jgi:hypothetical protein
MRQKKVVVCWRRWRNRDPGGVKRNARRGGGAMEKVGSRTREQPIKETREGRSVMPAFFTLWRASRSSYRVRGK